jgi:hypothetical protein
MTYVLVLYITTISIVNGQTIQTPGTKVLGEFESLRQCYDHAKSLKLNVEAYSCLRKNL